MHRERIAELLEPFLGSGGDQRLNGNDLDSISTYIDILIRWNSRVNLTAIRNEEEIVTRHFGESLFAARHLFPRRTTEAAGSGNHLRFADLGSGAGFPGIPIKLWAPYLPVTLIEANLKKATFLREVVRALTLTSVDIQNARAESLSPSSFGVVTLRAVEKFADALPVAAGLVTPAGRLELLIASGQVAIAHALAGFVWEKPISIPKARSRILLIGTKSMRENSSF
jgi:16S rRNA (guanine527-N7)-methyltransferase